MSKDPFHRKKGFKFGRRIHNENPIRLNFENYEASVQTLNHLIDNQELNGLDWRRWGDD